MQTGSLSAAVCRVSLLLGAASALAMTAKDIAEE
jgi:hypothetical protein